MDRNSPSSPPPPPQDELTLSLAQLLAQPLLVWSVTTLAIFLGMLCLLKTLSSAASKNKRQPTNGLSPAALCTRVVDAKDGSREMNPEYVPRHGKHENAGAMSQLPESICEAILLNARTHPEAPMFGEHGDPRAPYEWLSLGEFVARAKAVGAGLKHLLGVEPGSETRVGILAGNSVQWVTSHMGLLFYSNVAVPLYATLGEQALLHIVRLTEMRVCLCQDEAKAVQLTATLRKDPPLLAQLQHLVLLRPKSEPETQALRQQLPAHVALHTLLELQEAGQAHPLELRLPRKDQTYVLNFTSGTTGIPKGVIVTCDMFHHVIVSILGSKSVFNWMDPEDVYFSFLPLAHVFEQCLMAACLFVRARVGFFSGDLQRLMDDIESLRPTMLAMVPRLLCRVHDGFRQKLQKHRLLGLLGGGQWLLEWAVKSKLRAIEERGAGGPVADTWWDRLLFRPLQQKMGGRVRLVISGSAACPPDVVDFCRAALGAVLHVGYGASETAGPITITYTDDLEASHVGVPIIGTRVKLADVPDMELYPSRLGARQRGEICVRGPSCTPGYFRDPERTRELIDSQGWLHTGDVGEWDSQGRLCIVDRCKNMFKLAQGEYVAPDRVESVYLLCPLVSQAFLDGRGDQSFAVALIHPDMPRLAERLSLLPDAAADDEALCALPEARQLMLQELAKEAKKAGLTSFEQAKRLHLIAKPFTCEDGLLTATLKPVRTKIRQHYAQTIEQLYQ